MRKITQAELDALPVVYGVRQCPTADYSAVTIFGAGCSFGAWSSFGARSIFGAWSSFGKGSSFGEGCQIENGNALLDSCVYSAGGFGSAQRTTYGFAVAGGVLVRCGCWVGMLPEFRERVREVHGGTPVEAEYLAMADMFEARRKRAVYDSKGKDGEG